MDRITFIKSLAAELAYKTKPSEIHHLIDYYDEMIQDLMEEGLSEVEAVARLGTQYCSKCIRCRRNCRKSS
ncbi:HAAS signaling domain-containing protein [Enterococcus gallinarum]|uniref:HAAS signaling domain-containing protein n=1 Tax=Enterococcus gallinarum TaxID=1353 RepID=UPI00288FD415|nr:hypothetical protein [Enterococcus gallinarum]MDT2680346.1 hypothetical protein [Enterococcus gallinarum]